MRTTRYNPSVRVGPRPQANVGRRPQGGSTGTPDVMVLSCSLYRPDCPPLVEKPKHVLHTGLGCEPGRAVGGDDKGIPHPRLFVSGYGTDKGVAASPQGRKAEALHRTCRDAHRWVW